MKLLKLLLSAMFILLPVSSYSETKPNTHEVKVAWILKTPPSTTEDGKTDKGIVLLPLKTTSECVSKYKINKMLFNVDTTDKNKVLKALSGQGSLVNLEVVIIKQYQGRGHAPEIIIVTKKGDKYNLNFSAGIDVNMWPKRGYKIIGDYQADKMVFPEHWKEIEMICH